ncbi:MAG: alpha-beta hydrolase superfamily lysophospholipase [Candidatus Azotimanducaceae bacterium]
MHFLPLILFSVFAEALSLKAYAARLGNCSCSLFVARCEKSRGAPSAVYFSIYAAFLPMENFSFTASDGHKVACYGWPVQTEPKAIIYIAHGMGEHARRYDRVARQLNEQGYAVYANDHRGHGETGKASLGYMGPDGWNRTLADMYEMIQLLRARDPSAKLCLMGHSMGSMLSEQYITRYAKSIDALALCGSPGFKKGSFIGGLILKFERWRHEAHEVSGVMQGALFGNSNKPFDGPDATGSEWLTRDPEEVAKYADDEQCGFVLSVGSLVDMYVGMGSAQDPLCISKIPVDLPVYVFSGEEDPVHGGRLDIDRMLEAYREHGLTRLNTRFYEGGRHELFNETNKDEVITDLVTWLEDAL